MNWDDDGVVLSVRRHGETSAVVDLLTSKHGRHSGLVRGASSRSLRAVLQIGNLVQARWRGRLDEHLGHFNLEAKDLRASRWMVDSHCLFALQTLASHVRLLAPRDPSPRIYASLNHILDQHGSLMRIGESIVRFELLLLEELGFGLDLRVCASTGISENLTYVSPRSGRAVSEDAAKPYMSRLLRLPVFLSSIESDLESGMGEICDGLSLTGFFLQRNVYSPRNLRLCTERESLCNIFKMQN